MTTEEDQLVDRRSHTAIVWVLLAVVIVVPYVAWFDGLGSARRLNEYTVFPLLGIWAWSIMWIHYVYGTLLRLYPQLGRSATFDRISALVVLALILLHPGLLVLALWRDTGQVPPLSFLNYVGDGRELSVVLAAVALASFLSYEVLSRVRRTPFLRRNWRWVGLAQIAAMTLIFVHGLGLGRHLHSGWMRHYWVLLGALLVPCFAVIARADWTASPSGSPDH